MDEDQLTLFLESENDVFVPNIFSPDGDGVNDELIVFGGSGVESISSFIIYDRWGNVIFVAKDFHPNDEGSSWDGRFKDERLNPGVFAYRLIVRLKDGTSESRFGDITSIR
jgi:gliding motility-associated-like protein